MSGPRRRDRVGLLGGALVLAALGGACGSGPAGNGGRPGPAPEPAPREAAPAPPPRPAPAFFHFVDVSAEAGLAGFRQRSGGAEKHHLPETVGAGVAFLDFDRDGALDVYLTNGSSFEPSGDPPRDALFRGDGRGGFTEVTASAGLGDAAWTFGVTVADHDDDGWPDLYLTNMGPNRLYRNRGDGTFEDVTSAAGVGDPAWSTGAAFFDADGDHDLDLYVANYVVFDREAEPEGGASRTYRGVEVAPGPAGFPDGVHRIYRNEGGGRFRDVSSESLLEGAASYGFQPVAFDVELDGDQDVFVANDSKSNFLWLNDGGGRFRETAFRSGIALSENGTAQAGMGVALGDFDGNGLFDLYVTNFAEDYNTLYRNDGRGFFTDITHAAGLADPTYLALAWGCAFFDADSDGDLDLVAANGHLYPQIDLFDFGFTYAQPNQIFENGGGGRFVERTGSAGPGFALREVSRGLAVGDHDGDGDLDLLFGNLDGPPRLLRNDSKPAGNRLSVRLVGTHCNRDGIGARVRCRANGRDQWALVSAGTSFLSSSPPVLHFGLGAADRAEQLEVHWPDGRAESAGDVPAGREWVFVEGSGLRE